MYYCTYSSMYLLISNLKRKKNYKASDLSLIIGCTLLYSACFDKNKKKYL